MRKIITFLIMLICVTSIFAGKINQIIFFGDSLSDNGNLYRWLLKVIPKSPPYFQGRFSNGPTWAENVGSYYYNKYSIDYKIYAVGGATAILHAPSTKFIAPTTLGLELTQYFLESPFKNKHNVLYVIWIGGNDYLFDNSDNPNKITTQVVDRISWAMTTLIQHGAQNFLILNLPDLSKTPFAKNHGKTDKLQVLSQLHNQKLATAISKLQASYGNAQITLVNIYDLFIDMMANPDKYNQKYHEHITNLTDACWQGGIMLKNGLSERLLTNELQQLFTSKADNIDTQLTSHFIMQSPELAYVYQMGQLYSRGVIPCDKPNEYVFWDVMHPTATVHKVLGQMMAEQVANMLG